MARRLLKTINVGSRCAVKMYRDADTREFIVREIRDGKVTGGKADGGYFTEEKTDARGTAAHMVRRLRKMPMCRRAR